MIINIEKRRRFIPPIKGNATLPPEEQLAIDYDKPAAFQRQIWEKTYASRVDKKITTNVERDVRAIILGSNVVIHNLKANVKKDDGNVEVIDITTGEMLANSHSDICYYLSELLVNEIMSTALSEELVKNSKSASDAS